MILRPLFLFLTITMVVLALVTTTGRVVIAVMPRFEAQINALLVPFAIEISGLNGEWRYLNPVVYADTVRFSGGRAKGLRLEVDLLESAVNNALVAARLHVDELSLAFVRGTDRTWRLGEQPAGAAQFDIRTFLLESDAIKLPAVDIAFFFERGDGPLRTELVGQFGLDASFVNVASRHQADVEVAGADSGEVRLRYDISENWFGLLPDGRARLESESFSMPDRLGVALGGVGLDVARVDVQWEVREGLGDGQMSIAAEGLTLPTGHLDGFVIEVAGSSDYGHENWHFNSKELSIRGFDRAWDLSGLAAVLDGEGTWTFSLPVIDVATAAAVTRSALIDVDVANRWLNELHPEGRLDSVFARWSADGLTYSGLLTDGAIDDYRGAPEVRGVTLDVRGSERGVTAEIVGGASRLHFVGLLDEPSVLDHVSGSLTFGWKPGFFGIRGDELAIRQGESRAQGGFLLSRPAQRSEDRLVIMAEVWDMGAAQARSYLTTKLPENLLRWLDDAVVAGRVDHARIAYHGHVQIVPDLPMRQIELALSIDDGVIRFDPGWPMAEEVSGDVFVTTSATIGRLTSGKILNVSMDEGSLYVPNDAEYVAIAGLGRTDGASVLELIRETPLSDTLSFVHPDWTVMGPLSYRTDFKVPVAGAEDLLDVELDVEMHSVTVGLSDVDLRLGDLVGSAEYRYPFDVTATDVLGELFGHPASFGAHTLGQEVALLVSGRSSVDDILAWLALDDPGVASGELSFDATYRIWPDIERPSVVDVASDLVGVTVQLPAPFGKLASEPRQARADTVLADEEITFNAEVDGVGAVRLSLVDGAIAEGSLGIGIAPPQPLSDTLVVSGNLDRADIGDYIDVFAAADDSALTIGWLVDDLHIEEASYRDVPFVEMVINGGTHDEGFELSVVSPDLTASLLVPSHSVPRVDVTLLRLPATDDEDPADPADPPDPLAGIDVALVPDIDVRLSEVILGEESYGGWTFDLRNRQGELELEDLVADLKGLHIVGHEPVLWNPAEGVTTFDGTVSAENLAEVLPLWGYAASVESQSATVDAQITWLGSPLNFWIRDIVGQLDLEVRDGRFLDVETGSGPMRVFSLLNFNAIAKRMTFDFSDVFGKGISFDEIDAKMAVDHGFVNFIEPMVIDGTGSNFKVSGSVDLVNGDLDNEMIVTLPVNKSLPWYAAYLGIVASPLAAGAVLVGERIFREQIQQFSSARYKVAGTLESPTVTFVGVFNAKQQGPGKTEENVDAHPTESVTESASEAKDA